MNEPMRRQRRRALTDRMVAALPRRAKRYVLSDPEQRGMYIRVMPSGPHVYAAVARDPYGRQVWATIGSADVLGIEQARDKARKSIGRIREGKPASNRRQFSLPRIRPRPKNGSKPMSRKRGCAPGRRSSACFTNSCFHLAKRNFADIKRRDINELLDSIAKNSAQNADHVLAVTRKISKWYETRDDDYVSPFVAGMRRTKAEDRERDRTLDDEELRQVWHQASRLAEAKDAFGAFILILLLTAQRRGAVVRMKWTDLTPTSVWEIATEPREKGNADAVKLPEKALAIIQALPRFAKNPFVFAASRSNGPLNGFNKRKVAFDHACGVTDWTLHDLRRTARSLMSRAGVSDEHAEHTLGHKLQGVRKVYNRYDFFKEKSDALATLAALIERIVNPPEGDNVVVLHEAAVAS